MSTPPGPPSLTRHTPFTFGFFAALGALAAYFLATQLASLSGILVLLVMAMFLAIGLNPAVEWLVTQGLKRAWALLAVLAAVVGLLTLFVVAVAPVISDQIALITRNAPDWLDQLQSDRRVQDLDNRFDIISRARDYVSDGDFGASVFGGALGVGLKVLSALTNTLIVLVLTIYFLASLPSIKEAAYAMAPASRRPRVRILGDRMIRSTGAYVSGAFQVAFVAGVFGFFLAWGIGLGEYKWALAFVVGVLSLIPVVGAFISAVVMTLLALTVSPTHALIALALYLAYQQFEGYVLYPRIMKKAVDIPGAVTVVAALVGGSLMGVLGALLAVPVAAALLMLHREVFLTRQDAR